MNVLTGRRTASLLEEDSKELSGKSFCKHMEATAKAKEESKEVYHNLTSTQNTCSGDCTNPSVKTLHSLVPNSFPKGEMGNFSLAGRLQYFLENCKILANDSKY